MQYENQSLEESVETLTKDLHFYKEMAHYWAKQWKHDVLQQDDYKNLMEELLKRDVS